MPRRRIGLNWRLLVAAGVGVAVVIIGLDFDLAFVVSLLLGLLAAALLYARIAGQPRVASTAPPARRRPAAPALQAGHEVITIRDLGGALSEHVPRGTKGVVTSTAWDGIHASFTLYGAFGVRQVQVRVRPDDVRRI